MKFNAVKAMELETSKKLHYKQKLQQNERKRRTYRAI